MDFHTKSVAWVPGPGTHKTRRQFDAYPEDDAPSDTPDYAKDERKPRWQDVVDRKVYVTLERKSARACSLPNLREFVKECGTSNLPSSYMTPGPGAYTAFSSFGSPSGPTRKRYFAASKSDHPVGPREIEEYNKESTRGLEGRNYTQLL